MAYKSNNKVALTVDGIPYMWGSGNNTTVPSNVVKLTAYDGAASDYYGVSVAVGSGRIVIGSYQDDDNGVDSGSAYVYDLDGNLITKLTAYDGAASDYYGVPVAVGSGRIVICATAAGIGVVYVYDLDGNLITKLTAYDGAFNDRYGNSVAVGSGRIVVGSYVDDDMGTDSGSAYVYDLDGNLITKLSGAGGYREYYSRSVAVGSGRMVICATGDGVLGYNVGSVYVYDLNATLITKISGFIAYDQYGISVAVRSGRIVVGAYRDDDKGIDSGSAYVYDLDGNLITKLTAYDGAASDYYGNSVAVGSGRIVIGSLNDDDLGAESGSAYVYDLDGNLITKLTAYDGAASDYYGASVAVGSGRIVVGAYLDDDNGLSSGSAYIYTTPQVITLYDAKDLAKGHM